MTYPSASANLQDLFLFFRGPAFNDRAALKYLYKMLLSLEDPTFLRLTEQVAARLAVLPPDLTTKSGEQPVPRPQSQSATQFAAPQPQPIPQGPPMPTRPTPLHPIPPMQIGPTSLLPPQPSARPELNQPKSAPLNPGQPGAPAFETKSISLPSGTIKSRNISGPSPVPRAKPKLVKTIPPPPPITWHEGGFSFGPPEQIIVAVQSIRNKFIASGKAPKLPRELDIEAILQRLSNGKWENEAQRRQDRRYLPSLMLYQAPSSDEDIARHKLVLDKILRELSQDATLRSLKNVISAYLSTHHSILSAHIAQWIQEGLSASPKQTRIPSWFAHWQGHGNLFSPNPTEYACRFLPPQVQDWSDWEQLQLPDSSWVCPQTMAHILERAIQLNDDETRRRYYAYLNRKEEQPGTTISRSHFVRIEKEETIKLCAERALLAYSQDAPPDSELINLCFDVFGDPRHIEEHKWLSFEPRARELMELWLSLEDLEFFFENLFDFSDADDSKSRIQYWKRFVDKKLVRRSRLYIGAEIEKRKRHLVKEQLRTNRYGRLCGAQDRELCAFVLQINNTVAVEFSKTGNSCSLFRHIDFPPEHWKISRIDLDALKADTKKGIGQRETHIGNWKSRFDRILLEKFGIRI